jgi:hypothetical protein
MKTFKLENEPKIETGFITPEHYFENFQSKWWSNYQTRTKSNFYFSKKKNIFMLVAAVLVLALMIPILNPSTENSKILML